MVHWVNQQFMARNAPDWTFKAVLEFANLYYMRNQLSPLSAGAGVAKSGARSMATNAAGGSLGAVESAIASPHLAELH